MHCSLLKTQHWNVESKVLKTKVIIKKVKLKSLSIRPNKEINADFWKDVF